MRQRLLVRAACVASAMLFASAAYAATKYATVDPSHGIVLVNRGKGFTEIRRPVRLRVGSSVMVGPNGGAVIAYNDGCTVNVKPGTVKSIDPISPCASGSQAAADPSYMQQSNGNWCDDNHCIFWGAFGAMVGAITYEIVSISP